MVKNTAKVRARLEGLFPSAKGITKERLDVISAKLKATDESTDDEIDTELTEMNDNGLYSFEQMKKDDDRIRNEIAKSKKTTSVEDNPDDTEEVNSTDPAVQALVKEMSELKAALAAKTVAETLSNLHAKFKADERLKDVPASWVKNNLPTDEESYETAVTSLTEDYNGFLTTHKLGNLSATIPPAGGNSVTDKKEISDEEASSLAKQLLSK